MPKTGGTIKSKGFKLYSKRGFTLIELLIDFTILALVAGAIVSGYFASYKSIGLAAAKSTAVAIANEKIELLRNMPYDSLATKQGAIYPPGDILDNETLQRNGSDFSIKTAIAYIDDPYDGNIAGTIAGKPTDIYPYDYKKIEVSVYKPGKKSPLAKLSSNVSAKAAETPTDTGIIRVCVIDSNRQPVVAAIVNISNSSITPAVDISVETEDDGCIMIPKLPPDEHNGYHVTVTKDGYSTDLTFPRTPQNPNAWHADENIIIQQVTEVTLSIDRFSTMNFHFVDQAGSPVPNLGFQIKGSKEAYFNPMVTKCSPEIALILPDSPCVPVYRSDANGDVSITGLDFDDYQIINVTGGFIISTSPMQAIHLGGGLTLAVTAVVTQSDTTPGIYNFTPTKSKAELISLTVAGSNFQNDSTIKLTNSTTGQEVVGTNLEIHPHDQIAADFNLTGLPTGMWHLTITNSDGQSVTQNNGLEVIAP